MTNTLHGPDLPCGCRSTRGPNHRDVFIQKDGTRLCKHGRRWKLTVTAVEVKQ